MKFLQNFGRIGFNGKLYENLADPMSTFFGGAGKYNSLGMPRTGQSEGVLGEQSKGIDWFGSPVTAGTDAQPYARGGALLYGGYMGAGALGGAGGTTGAGTTQGGGAAATSSSPGWAQWLRMIPRGGQRQQQQYQPNMQMYDDGTQQSERDLLAKILQAYGG